MSIAFSGLLIPIALIAFVIFGIRKLKFRKQHGANQGVSVRRFFQYLLLYILVVVSALGLSGLLGRILERSTLVVADKTDLARNLSFVVVAIPLVLLLALWTRRQFRGEPAEAESSGWAFYLMATSITSLAISMFALYDTLSWAVRVDNFRAQALARLVVWGCVWSLHWWVHLRSTTTENSRAHHFLGSLIGLGTAALGVEELICSAVQRIWNFGGEAIFIAHDNSILRGAVMLSVGAPIWYLYWVRNYSKASRDPLWFVYVLLVGVGGGLVVSVVSASTVLYSVLVWLIGDTGNADATTHFRTLPAAFGTVCIGVLTWWYHQAILEKVRNPTRSEVQRVYEYLMSGIGLLAAAGGLAMILVALLEAMTSTSIISGNGATNALLAAVTLLIVGGPVWWIFWHKITNEANLSPEVEHASPARRVYLFALFGVGGILAVVTLLIGVFFIFDDILKGNFGQETLRRIRFAFAILLATGTIAGYHWFIYRSERDVTTTSMRGPRLVILVGPKNAALVVRVSQLTGGQVQSWERTDDHLGDWSMDEVIQTLEKSESKAIILVADSKGLQAIPIARSY